jgi:hypothetical protein
MSDHIGIDTISLKPTPRLRHAEDCSSHALTFGTQDQIRAEMDATLKLAFDCPGFMFAVGDHLPSNVLVENAEVYFEYLKANWKR